MEREMSFTTPRGINFARLLEFPVRQVPDKVAYVDGQEQATFKEIDARANALARRFLKLGGQAGDRVAIILPNGIPFIVAEIAIVKAGMVKVPLNIRFHSNEVLYSLEDCQPRFLVCERDYGEAVRAQSAKVPSLNAVFTVGGRVAGCRSYEEEVAADGAGAPFWASRGGDDPILIRYTGGTTGRPKGIVHTNASFLNINLDVIRELQCRQSDVALHIGHLSHGVNFMWAAFHAVGATQILRERFEPAGVLHDLEARGVTFTYMVPTMIHRLLDADDGNADISSLRMFMYASAPMPVPLLRRAMERYGSIFTQVYTLSEAPVITTILRAEEHVDKETIHGTRLASCGREVVTMDLRLVDDDGCEVENGQGGEIAVRSINNMAAYWRLREETSSTLVDGWVRTGDMAKRDEDGFLYIIDRKKDMIITGGLNVYPKEVEDVLYQHPAVAQAAVVGVPDEEWGECIKAFVVRAPGEAVSETDLVEFCQTKIASYKKPRYVEFRDSLPTSGVGKVMRSALKQKRS